MTQNAKRLSHGTLTSIMTHPVFQATDESFHDFGMLCLINDIPLREMIAGHVKIPSSKTLALVRARPGVFRLRTNPSIAEARDWYQKAFGPLAERNGVLDPQDLEQVDHVEAGIERLLQIPDRALGRELRGWKHKTLSRSGGLRPMNELHALTDAVSACKLSDDDLVGSTRAATWKNFGLRELPSAAAILRVLTEGTDENTFFRRLSAYLSDGGDSKELAKVPCVPTPVGMKIPPDVALRRGPWLWGSWKTEITVGIPERVRSLREIGVLPAELREADSRDFFLWLRSQDDRTQRAHTPEIGRHWREHRQGPLRWWRNYENLACLPIIAGGKFLLVSYAEAMSRPVYLPDFPAINQQFAQSQAQTGLVHETILRQFAELRRDGIRSLRELMVGRGEVSAINPIGLAEQRHQVTLGHIRAAAASRKLTSELSRIGVRPANLRLDFLHVMAQLSEVRRAEKIAVSYRIGSTVCETEASAGLDGKYILWLTNDASDMAAFEALAERLFHAGEHVDTAPYKLFQAVHAVHKNHGRLALAGGLGEDGDGQASSVASADPESSTRSPRGTPTGHHTPPLRDPIVPNPAPFPDASQEDFAASGRMGRMVAKGSSRTPTRGSTSERRNTVREEIEKAQLKRDHYAYHCQVCLGLRQPDSLTPKFTYLWDKDYRTRNIEAHHVEHLRDHGALGAGNLVILCEYHHDFLGNRLDREAITRALETAHKETRRFSTDVEGLSSKSVVGRLIKIQLDVSPYEIPIFFTAQHADAWLARVRDISRNDIDGEEAT